MIALNSWGLLSGTEAPLVTPSDADSPLLLYTPLPNGTGIQISGGCVIVQGNAANNAVNASGSGTSEQAHLDKGPPQANTPASQRSLAVYTPTTIRKASSSVLQSVNQAAQVAGRQVSSAGAHSCMVVASAAHHSAHSTVAAAQAVMQFSQQLAGKTCSFGHRTGVAVYQGLEQASSGVALKQAALTRYTGRS